jgi:flagellar motility protein MotE (MotC chaperone)
MRVVARLRAGRGALWFITGLLVTSAAIRAATGAVGDPAGPAPAAEALPPPEAECTPPPDIAETLELLADRQAELDTRAAELADLEATLALARSQVEARMQDLAAAEEELSGLIAIAEGAAEDDLARLTAVYEKMKPKEAALVFEAMAPDFAAGFLARMRPDAAAEILAGLRPEAAYTISVLLAGRNANAPTE